MMSVDYIVNSIYTSRSYIVSFKERNSVIIDVGDVKPLLAYIKVRHLSVNAVFLTHAHFDHIYGLPELLNSYPDLQVYTNEFGKMALGNERINMSRYHEMPINYEGENVRVVRDGERIPLFDGLETICYETPGHNPSCLTFEIGEYLFTGDAYIPGVEVVTNLPRGDKLLAKESLNRIQLLARNKTICPGHELTS